MDCWDILWGENLKESVVKRHSLAWELVLHSLVLALHSFVLVRRSLAFVLVYHNLAQASVLELRTMERIRRDYSWATCTLMVVMAEEHSWEVERWVES